ncbi:unnamed protein product [Mesocestoides corti]|uniref:Cadherin domain-containing protein n=2 Tax=Mesocestoides corti TaxID=53468 RepID=A0A3P6HY25_MESCO|nr:unnamed protein product [Mesocestoides corti]
MTNEPRLGVPEPFNGQPSGAVVFSIIGSPEVRSTFSTETVKLGGFYFLRLRTNNNAEFNTKKRSIYAFDVQAVFQSQKIGDRPPIKLSNQTHIVIRVIDRNDNCPFFSQDTFHWTVFENATLFTRIGTVSATDADTGISGQIYFVLQPERTIVPFRIDARSGDVFPTKSLAIKRGKSSHIEQTTYLSMYEGLEDYSFRVIARHRGNLSHVPCEFVIHAQVNIRIQAVRSSGPKINSVLFSDIPKPGAPGTAYASIKVTSPSDPQNIQLTIIETEAMAIFELVRVGFQPEWLLRLKAQYPLLSLNSRIGVTLKAVDTEYASVENIPSTSQDFLDVALLPWPMFRIHLPREIKVSVSEVALVNSTIFIINPKLDYYIHNSSFLFSQLEKNEELPFEITKTGAVVVTKSVDLETLRTNLVEVPFTVVDQNNILLSSLADSKLVINIIDYNEHDPVISNSVAERSIPESLPVGSEVLQIEAYDPDFSATRLSFSLFDEDKLPFIFSTTKPGSLILKTRLDAETMPAEFHIKVKVSDSGLPFPRSAIVIYVIRIIDVNEFSPVFVEKSCSAQLAVTSHGQIQILAPSGLELGSFFAEDLDRDGSSTVQIRLASTTVTRPCFKIDPVSGRLLLICSNIGPPGTTVSVYLEATDGNRTSEQPFELKINLVQADYGHVFSKSCQPSNIYEKVQEQKQKRTDYEHLISNSTSIDSFFKRFDVESAPSLSIPPTIKIPENLPIGTPILHFGARFVDPLKPDRVHRLVYGVEAQKTLMATGAMMTPPYQAFCLRGKSTSDVDTDEEMTLEVAAPIDREAFSAFLLSIQVCVLQESLGPCVTSNLTIHIEDLPDEPPKFVMENKNAHTFSVSENDLEGSFIGQMFAEDGDAESKLRFSLRNFKDTFRIHHRTGRISLKKKLDRELVDSYLLTVKVRDVLDLPPLASPSHLHALALNATPDWALVRTATTYVRVNVLDTNDNRPEFIATYDNLVVPADLPEGAYVTTLRARDADSGHNAVLQYSLFGGEADKMCFDCELTTGVVRIAPDCGGLRPGHVYSLTAWVCDLGTPDPLQTSSPFKVTVVDLRVNVWPPRFDAPNGLYEGKLLEGVPIGSKVMQIGGGQPLRVSASDPEDLPIVFRADGGSGLGIFTVSDDGKSC